MVNVSDGKSYPEPARLRLTMELLILQRVDTSTPSLSIGPPTESTVCQSIHLIEYLIMIQLNSIQCVGTYGSN